MADASTYDAGCTCGSVIEPGSRVGERLGGSDGDGIGEQRVVAGVVGPDFEDVCASGEPRGVKQVDVWRGADAMLTHLYAIDHQVGGGGIKGLRDGSGSLKQARDSLAADGIREAERVRRGSGPWRRQWNRRGRRRWSRTRTVCDEDGNRAGEQRVVAGIMRPELQDVRSIRQAGGVKWIEEWAAADATTANLDTIDHEVRARGIEVERDLPLYVDARGECLASGRREDG